MMKQQNANGEGSTSQCSGSTYLLSLKIGRNTYEITEKDKFLDNGVCVQIITQKGPFSGWSYGSLVMTKASMKAIAPFQRVIHPHKYMSDCVVFSLSNATSEPQGSGKDNV